MRLFPVRHYPGKLQVTMRTSNPGGKDRTKGRKMSREFVRRSGRGTANALSLSKPWCMSRNTNYFTAGMPRWDTAHNISLTQLLSSLNVSNLRLKHVKNSKPKREFYCVNWHLDAWHSVEVSKCHYMQAGTSTWMKHFLGFLPSQQQGVLSKAGSGRLHRAIPLRFKLPNVTSVTSLIKSSVSFSFVRHPFERWMSDYKI